MKNSFVKKLALGLAALTVVGSLSACGNNDSTSESSAAGSQESTTETVVDGNGNDTPLVVGYSYFSSKFSPFFATTAYDQDVADITSVPLLGSDREGNVVLKGIEGTTVAYNGVDYLYTGIADCEITQNDDGTVVYEFVLRDDITFSDGTPLTADDVIF